MNRIIFNVDIDNQPTKIEIKYGKMLMDFENKDFDAEDVTVLFDGQQKESLGTNFAGYKYNEIDALKFTILAYINNDTSYKWVQVPEEIKNLKKERFEEAFVLNGRSVPKVIYNSELEPLNLALATIGMLRGDIHYRGNIAYVGQYDECFLADGVTGKCVTDMECFFLSAVESMLTEEQIVYESDKYAKNIKEYLSK